MSCPFALCVAVFRFEAFKEDVTTPVVPAMAMPVTLRRKLVDVAAKIVTHADRTILKLTDVAMETLNFKELWERCLGVPKFVWSYRSSDCT